MKKMIKLTLLFTGIICMAMSVRAEIRSEFVDYEIAGQSFQGYLTYDDSISGKRPGVLVVHEWWGHNAFARKRADKLAKLGYTAFALDMYGTGKLAKHPDDAEKFMKAATSNMKVAEARFNKAKRILQIHSTVDTSKIAAIGYCFGGGTVLHMARQGADLAGVVSFHGSLSFNSPPKKGKVKAKVLVLNGANDPFVSTKQINSFKREMKNAEADFELVNYLGAKHSFTNRNADKYGKLFNMPLAYNTEADKHSWQRMHWFLKQVFK